MDRMVALVADLATACAFSATITVDLTAIFPNPYVPSAAPTNAVASRIPANFVATPIPAAMSTPPKRPICTPRSCFTIDPIRPVNRSINPVPSIDMSSSPVIAAAPAMEIGSIASVFNMITNESLYG